MKKFFASIITLIRTIDQKLTRAILKTPRIQNIITSMEASIHDLNNYIDELADVKDREIAQLNAELEQQKRIVAAQDELIAILIGNVDDHDWEVNQLCYKIDSLNRGIETRDRHIAVLTKQKAQLKRELDSAINGLREENERLRETINNQFDRLYACKMLIRDPNLASLLCDPF